MDKHESDAAQRFAADAVRLRFEAQKQYAQQALERLYEIAMRDDPGAVQVSALREFLEQVLGRPMAAAVPAVKEDEDVFAAISAFGARLREKLDRIAQSGGTEASDGTSE